MSSYLDYCAISFAAYQQHQKPVLKDVNKDSFLIGVAINQRQFSEQDARGVSIITSQFNSISPENVLKWESVHPQLWQV